MNSRFLTRSFVMLASILLISLLAACGKKETPVPTPTFTPIPPTPTPARPTATPTPNLIVPRVEPILPEAQPTPETTPVPVPTMDVQSALLEAPDLTSNIFVEYILDASGSMLGQLADHTRKRDVAEKVLSQRIRSFPSQINIGFRAFGHHMDWRGQEEKSCQDIELIAPVQTGQLEKVALWLENDYDAKGMTPLAQSIRYAAEDLPKEGEVNNAIVLISDGEETCGGDPCAVVQQLKDMGIHFTLHVVGMNVQPEDAEQLLCVARAGQGYYIPVQTAQEMNRALETIEKHIAEGNEPMVAQLPPTPTPTSIPPTPTPTSVFEKGNWIAYVGHDGNIWMVETETRKQHKLTDLQFGRAISLAWSPDGKELAFSFESTEELRADIGVIDIITGEIRWLLTSEAKSGVDEYIVHVRDLAWNPDGTMLYYSTTADTLGRYWELRRIRGDGTGRIEIPPISNGWDFEGFPTFSPNGQWLLYGMMEKYSLVEWPADYWGIWLADSNALTGRKIINGINGPISWGPDSNHFIFYGEWIAKGYGEPGVYLAALDDPQPHLLIAANSGYDPLAKWSPNGQWIAFHILNKTATFETLEIWLINQNGTKARKVAEGYFQAWSPNGQYFLFTTGRPYEKPEIWIINKEESSPRKIAEGSNPAWLPTSK